MCGDGVGVVSAGVPVRIEAVAPCFEQSLGWDHACFIVQPTFLLVVLHRVARCIAGMGSAVSAQSTHVFFPLLLLVR